MIAQPTEIDFTLGEITNAFSQVAVVRLSKNLNEKLEFYLLLSWLLNL